MTWTQLKTFHMVALRKSFTRAAEELHMSQPAVSAQIQSLEKHYGIKLFARLGKKIALTEAGEILLSYAERILNLTDEAKQAIDELKGLKRGRLKIGASFLVGVYIMPQILGRFKTRYPDIEVSLQMRQAQEIVKMVLSNAIDLGVVGAPVEDPRLVVKPFLSDELLAIVPADHPWAEREAVRPQELERQPFILSEQGSATRQIVEEQLGQVRVKPEVAMELGNIEAVKKAVEAGLGISIMSRSAAWGEVEAGRLRFLRVLEVNLRRDVNLVYHKDKHFSSALGAFWAFLAERHGVEMVT